MTTERSHRLRMGKWLICVFSIIWKVMWTVFGSYDYVTIVYPVYWCVLFCVTILFGYHGKMLKQEICKRDFAPGPCCAPAGKKTKADLLSGLVKKHRRCSIGGSGNMQLKYLFPHHFFYISMKRRAWQVRMFWRRQINYKRHDSWEQWTYTYKDKNIWSV